MIYVGITLSILAVITAISGILSEKRKRERAKRRLERFEKNYPSKTSHN